MPQSILQDNQALIKKVFRAYCLKRNIHLSDNARKGLFKRLLLYLEQNWENTSVPYENEIPQDSLIVEWVREACLKLFKNNNAKDIELLHTDVGKLVVKYQSIIKHIVYKQRVNGEPLEEDIQADLIANIQARLLQKADSGKLTQQYKGDALFSTYFYKIAYHSMIDELRKIRRHKKATLSSDVEAMEETQQLAAGQSLIYTDLVEGHLRRLQTFLKVLPSQRRRRFEFALKILYKMKLIEGDIRGLYADCSDKLLVEVLSYFGKNYHELPQAALFTLIAEFIGELEGDKISVNSESFRHWFQAILIKLKKTLFKELPQNEKKARDAYFEFLIYKFYKKN
ncbi:MAG: hypothetical protein R3E32_15045 [Chitinophagales bacterium]